MFFLNIKEEFADEDINPKIPSDLLLKLSRELLIDYDRERLILIRFILRDESECFQCFCLSFVDILQDFLIDLQGFLVFLAAI